MSVAEFITPDSLGDALSIKKDRGAAARVIAGVDKPIAADAISGPRDCWRDGPYPENAGQGLVAHTVNRSSAPVSRRHYAHGR